MALARRDTSTFDIWPGFVDALATLLMVIIFLLMIFVVAQFYLNDALTGRDEALQRLNRQIAEMGDLLNLERKANTDLRGNLAQLSTELQSSLADRDELSSEAATLRDLRASLTSKLEDAGEMLTATEADRTKIAKEIEDAFKVIEADRETIEVQLSQLAELRDDVAAMQALRKQLAAELESATGELSEEREISVAAKAQVALLNKQLAAIREQIAKLNEALEASEAKDKKQRVKIVDLGKRLNVALASKVQELARYRSEFFGRLREVLGKRADITIVGDRFVFQSEVLFQSGSAELGLQGQDRIRKLAGTLKQIAARIPDDISWVLRIDGHTDNVPIATAQFPSNWELSTARATSVVKFLVGEGIPAKRLAVTGFGEFQPLDDRQDEIAFRRNRRIELKFDQR